MNIYVGNLSYNTTEADLREAFAKHGEVNDVRMITDRDTGRSKGFGFVEMPNEEEARAAMGALNETDMHERTIKVIHSHLFERSGFFKRFRPSAPARS